MILSPEKLRMNLSSLTQTKTAKAEPTTLQTAQVADKPSPSSAKIKDLSWQVSAIMAHTLRLVGHHDRIHDQALAFFCTKIQEMDQTLEPLASDEKNLIKFLVRDWIIQTFTDSGSGKLIRMQSILRSTDITGIIAGRKRAIDAVSTNRDTYQHAIQCLDLIHHVSPEYTELAHYRPVCTKLPPVQASSSKRHDRLLLSAIVIAIIGSSFFLL